MIKFKTGDLLITRDFDIYIYTEYYKAAFSLTDEPIFLNDYKNYKHSTNKDYDIVTVERDKKILYNEFKFEKPTKDTPIDTRVLVWSTGTLQEAKQHGILHKRHFKEIYENEFIVFEYGKTSFTITYNEQISLWENAVIYEDGMLD